MPVYYDCQRCTACCRWPGQVKLGLREIDAIANYLGLEVESFTERYTQLRPDRTGLSLQNKVDGACIFLDGKDCRIQAVKPRQCRGFPNTWKFPGFEKVCEARPREVSQEEYTKLVSTKAD